MQNKLQGLWQVVRLHYGTKRQYKNITITFKGNELHRIENGKKWKRRIEFHQDHSEWISIIPITEPFLGETLLGRIKIENGQLHLIHSWPNELRPADFIPKNDSNAVLLIAERYQGSADHHSDLNSI